MEKKTYEAGASAYTLGVANSILNYADEYGQASKAELENMPKDASVDQWKKKMEEIAEEFICTPRYFLMCWLAAKCLNKNLLGSEMELGEFPAFQYKPKGARKAKKFEKVTRAHALSLDEEELKKYITIFTNIVWENERPEEKEKDLRPYKFSPVFRRAFLLYVNTQLLTKEEGLQIAHMIRLSYEETCYFLVRAVENDGLDFTKSTDIIHAYCLLRGKSYGVFQQLEAEYQTKAAGIEIIVAINKIDKPSANIERVKQELSEYELIPEDWGGSTIFVPVSAHTGEGIDTLLEMILLTAEVCELKANPNRSARGLVIEAQLDKGKGPVATILVQKGTLHVGDFIAAGACNGKVRAMMDDKGRRIKEAGPSTPVEILGLGDVPNAGEILLAFDSDKEAKNFAGAFVSENKNRLLEETKGKLSLDNLFDQIQASDLKELPLIVKADVQGSVEAVKQSLTKLSNEEVVVKVIHGGVGAINESDVSLAATSNAIIIGFNVRPDATAKQLAEQEGVDLRLYRVIYQAIEDVEAAMKGMLDPVFEEKVIGHAEVRQLFKASGVGTIAGSYILDGIFQRNCKVRISREGEQVFEGELASLKRFKDDVKEVKAGYECGLVFDGFNDVKEEDKVEAYIMVEVPR